VQARELQVVGLKGGVGGKWSGNCLAENGKKESRAGTEGREGGSRGCCGAGIAAKPSERVSYLLSCKIYQVKGHSKKHQGQASGFVRFHLHADLGIPSGKIDTDS